MLRNVIEDYLESISEIQFFLPFIQLLEGLGFSDIHLLHSPTEYGKDIIAKKDIGQELNQFSFQLKAKRITSGVFSSEVRPQLIQALTNQISHPNFDRTIPYQVVFVTTSNIPSNAAIDFQEFNAYVESTLRRKRVEVWEVEKLVADFLKVGIEPFFALHKSPDIVATFFHLYSEIKNHHELDFLEVERYTRNWFDLEIEKYENRLQVFFEGFFFSKILSEEGRYYEAVLFLSGLCRLLLQKNLYSQYGGVVEEAIRSHLISFSEGLKKDLAEKETLAHLIRPDMFWILNYPVRCLQCLELVLMGSLLFPDRIFKECAGILLAKEKGCFRPIGDNFAVSIVLVSVFLVREGRIEELKAYLTKVTVWLCDRYESIGVSKFGSTRKEEFEQLLSEHLDGFEFSEGHMSLIANVLLDICYSLGDAALYENVANDLKAMEIIPEFYHILEKESLFTYDKRILGSHDPDFSVEFKEDYTVMIKYEREKSKLESFEKWIYLVIFSLRDRYFPTIVLREPI